ncbi:MAG TPA: malonyl-CoA decarboxylase [Alphaproteobacteria bacterium]|jgi:malonyl-CoA decarboxylase|nr:malonyl-CoA decarboxylase [Alphaproteobacteria bacterium]
MSTQEQAPESAARPAPAGFFDRAVRNIRRAWKDVAGSARVALTGAVRADLPDEDAERLASQIAACLEARGGEVSARARAADLGRTYLGLSATGRHRFLRLLADNCGVDREALKLATAALQAAGSEAFPAAEAKLRAALVPPRVKLLTQFNALSQGVKFLVDMRADLLPLARHDAGLKALDDDLKGLLASWFDIGFLDLKRITWEAPAALLERLIAYEAVHAIQSWEDLKNRLSSDRRCYAFFHPRMPDEPLIFIEVALVNGMAGNVQELLDEDAPVGDAEDADTAIFYSISNAQKGLAGVSFGNFLIKRVVDDLLRELPGLKRFATLSPIPGFRRWLESAATAGDIEFRAAEERSFMALTGTDNAATALAVLLARPNWPDDADAVRALQPLLLRCAARYLLEEKQGGAALDRVAHFHLSNGARVEHLNWLGNASPEGLKQSAGLMVNYRYKLADIETNHEAYSTDGTVVAVPAVRNLLK